MALWQPTIIRRVIKSLGTSTLPVIVETDAGEAYLKVINNPEGEHALAKEWVGTELARLFGLPTLDHAIIQVTDFDEITLHDGRLARAGPAFATRAEDGTTLGGGTKSGNSIPYVLSRLDNPRDVARLIVFDTWTLNNDRHSAVVESGKRRVNRDNVWVSREDASKDHFVLKAIDHTHCFTLGGDLSPKIDRIDLYQYTGVFGMFPEFRLFIDGPRGGGERRADVEEAAKQLALVGLGEIANCIASIPDEWHVDRASREALAKLLEKRAKYVSDNIVAWIWPELNLPFDR